MKNEARINTIYLDMDGVLANFDELFENKFGKLPKNLVLRRQKFWSHWDDFVKRGHFMELPLMPGADDLINFCISLKTFGIETEILSSTAGYVHHDQISEQKNYWLLKNNVFNKANFVPGGVFKSHYASSTNVLIDDTDKVLLAFKNSGGNVIKHISADTTIAGLKCLLGLNEK